MTADPHIEAHNDDTGDAADLLRYYRDGMDTYRQSSIEQTNKADALAARLEAAERDNERLRRERREAVGLALWVAAIESQPIESRVAWVEEMVGRYRVVRVQRRAALAAAQQPPAFGTCKTCTEQFGATDPEPGQTACCYCGEPFAQQPPDEEGS